MLSIDEIKAEYPLHWLVWNDEHQQLQDLLQAEQQQQNIEKADSRGRTPLMLAVRLGHLQSVKVLLAARCNANAEHEGWSIVQEAVCSGDAAVLTAILEVRDLQRHMQRVTHVPKLLQRLVEAPDFYIEMKWEFTSWVPLMSRMCPSDTYKVYKRGANVRIDTTLLGFDHTNWQRGDRSYIFKGQTDSATMIEIDHEAREVSIEQMHSVMGDISGIPPNRESVAARLNAPVSTNHVDMEKISFERNKTGIWGWRSDKTEDVSGYPCKVYAASNVEFVSKTRSEHLTEAQANRFKSSRNPLQNFLGISDEDALPVDGAAALERPLTPTPARTPETPDVPLLLTPDDASAAGARRASFDRSLSPEEYFSAGDLNGRDIGRKTRTASKVQRFKANLWLSEHYPIQLQEQVLPILDLMSTMASPHVSKLKDFITMQLPSGFPVKIEIPLFHVLNACVTFGNVFALDTPVPNVSNICETAAVPTTSAAAAEEAACNDDGAGSPSADDRLTCIIDDCCFDVPAHYAIKGADHRRQLTFEDEDDLLQFAIQQSLLETGSETEQVDIWEALKARRPATAARNFGAAAGSEEEQLQRVLQESLYGYHSQQLATARPPTDTNTSSDATTPDDDAATATRAARPTVVALTADADDVSPSTAVAAAQMPLLDLDADLAMALRISEQEQVERQLELEREQKMLDEALRLSLQDN